MQGAVLSYVLGRSNLNISAERSLSLKAHQTSLQTKDALNLIRKTKPEKGKKLSVKKVLASRS